MTRQPRPVAPRVPAPRVLRSRQRQAHGRLTSSSKSRGAPQRKPAVPETRTSTLTPRDRQTRRLQRAALTHHTHLDHTGLANLDRLITLTATGMLCPLEAHRILTQAGGSATWKA